MDVQYARNDPIVLLSKRAKRVRSHRMDKGHEPNNSHHLEVIQRLAVGVDSHARPMPATSEARILLEPG